MLGLCASPVCFAILSAQVMWVIVECGALVLVELMVYPVVLLPEFIDEDSLEGIKLRDIRTSDQVFEVPEDAHEHDLRIFKDLLDEDFWDLSKVRVK